MRSCVIGLAALVLSAGPGYSQETMAGYLVEEYSCIMCHTDMRLGFLDGVHSRRGILCTDCHGGDPTQFVAEQAHLGGFTGSLDKVEAVGLCLSCHGDLPRMRQFALEPVTEEMFLVSHHGQRLLVEGDTLAPSCGDCHGSHAILPRTDPRSPVNPSNISETCGVCHSDPDRVPAGLPTGQLEEWSESAHGQALLTRHNEQSAQCASCHGSHSALPPGVQEIPNVCGKCHQLVRQTYFQGPHGQLGTDSGEGVPCTACHENHRTEMPPLTQIASLCTGCHEADSPEGISGLELQEQIQRAEAAGDRAREAVRLLIESGEHISDEEVRLFSLETHLKELLVQAHTLDPMVVDELVRRISSLSTEIGERSDVVEEHRWERKLLVIPFWILLMGGVLLALRKRRRLGEPGADSSWGVGGGVGS
jgi:predicted CXXCH cytochrome family protein